MNSIKIVLWGRTFDLDIVFDCYKDEDVLELQREAVKLFLDNTQNIDLSLDSIKEYCLTSNRDDILENCIDNIFKYISPKYIFVPRENDKRVIAVMCNYKFDMEHGIAVIFENEQFSKIGKQDIIL